MIIIRTIQGDLSFLPINKNNEILPFLILHLSVNAIER